MEKKFNPIEGKSGAIIESVMNSNDIPSDESLQFKLRLSVEEVVENIVRYAYESGNGFIEVSTSVDGDTLSIRIKDGGKPFNPLAKKDPDVNASLEERQIGGLGIFLCKQMMDSVEYEYTEGCNVLTMKKIIK
ncbi:MAG: ATP-binding protein [Bacteroidales bacterium]|nr:ATP-binding protein [Candidatus Cacconaster caballi]